MDRPRVVITGLGGVTPIGIGVVILALWELLPLLGLVNPIILPPFTKVAEALYTLMQQPFFPGHLAVTFNEIMIGFVIGTLLGLGIGIALAVWPAAKRLTYPFVVGFQAIPKIVFAPLFIAWFGFGQTSKIVMAVVIGRGRFARELVIVFAAATVAAAAGLWLGLLLSGEQATGR